MSTKFSILEMVLDTIFYRKSLELTKDNNQNKQRFVNQTYISYRFQLFCCMSPKYMHPYT